jgi:hypothetical protein
MAFLLAVVGVVALPVAAMAQQSEPSDRSEQAPGQSSRAPIVVLGQREDLPTTPALQAEQRSVRRRLGANAAMFLRCADLPGRLSFSAMPDGPPQAQRTQHALHRFIARNQACYPAYPGLAAPELGACNPQFRPETPEYQICRVTFDRGALFERTLLEVVGDLRLTREDTFNSAVLQRFRQREGARNLGRDTNDRRYFDTVACMVQILPEQGVAMLLSAPGSERAEEAYRLLIGNGAPCVGYAKEVRADPDQFRAYVAEALYSWLAAVRRTDSLIVTGVVPR